MALKFMVRSVIHLNFCVWTEVELKVHFFLFSEVEKLFQYCLFKKIIFPIELNWCFGQKS